MAGRFLPGSMDKVDPEPDGGELDEAEEAAGNVVMTSGDMLRVRQAVDAALDAIAQDIERPLDGVLDASVARGGNLGLPTVVADIVTTGIVVAAPIAQRDAGSLSRSSIRSA